MTSPACLGKTHEITKKTIRYTLCAFLVSLNRDVVDLFSVSFHFYLLIIDQVSAHIITGALRSGRDLLCGVYTCVHLYSTCQHHRPLCSHIWHFLHCYTWDCNRCGKGFATEKNYQESALKGALKVSLYKSGSWSSSSHDLAFQPSSPRHDHMMPDKKAWSVVQQISGDVAEKKKEEEFVIVEKRSDKIVVGVNEDLG